MAPLLPTWLCPRILDDMRRAVVVARGHRRDGSESARDIARCHYPALPATMISEAVQLALAADGSSKSGT